MRLRSQSRKFLLEQDAVDHINSTTCKSCRSWLVAKQLDALCEPKVQQALSALRPKHRLIRLHVHPSNMRHYAVVADLILYSPETKHWYVRTRKVGVLPPT